MLRAATYAKLMQNIYKNYTRFGLSGQWLTQQKAPA